MKRAPLGVDRMMDRSMMAARKCPVCGEPWVSENADASVHNIAHLVEDHAWLIKHAVSFVQHPDRQIDALEANIEIERLRREMRKLNARIAWLKDHVTLSRSHD